MSRRWLRWGLVGLAAGALSISGGSGGFGGPPPSPASSPPPLTGLRFGDSPVALVSSDFNRDGFPDSAVAYASGWVIVRLTVPGDDSFFLRAVPVPLEGPGRPLRLIVSDWNRDGCPDLATIHRRPTGNLSIWLGNCDGTFRPHPHPPRSLGLRGEPRDFLVADLEEDGCPEGIAVGEGGVVALVFRGCRGDAAEVRPLNLGEDISLGARPGALAMGDFNGDGHPDLAVTDLAANGVTVLFGRGDGTFGVSTRLGLPLDDGPTALRAGDFNRDGLDDLLVVARFSGYIRVILGKPGGSLRPDGRFPTGSGPQTAVLEDFNRDGMVDVVTVNREGRSLTVLVGRGDGTFVPLQTLPRQTRPTAAAAADLNRDGCLDLLVAEEGSALPRALYGLCNGGFAERPPRPPRVEAGGPYQGSPGAALSLQGSASPDEGTELVRVRWSFGDGEFSEGTTVTHRYRAPGGYEACLFATDARGITAFDCAQVRIEAEISASAAASPPTPSPTSKPKLPVKREQRRPGKPALYRLDGRPLPEALAVGDFNGDGRPDLAVGIERPGDREGKREAEPAELVVWLNRGATLEEGFRLPLEVAPERLAVLDLDRDGKLDLLLRPRPRPSRPLKLLWLRGQGDGAFDPPASLPPPSRGSAEAWLVRDLDGDGRDDWAGVSAENDLVWVLLTRLGERVLAYGVGRSPRALASGDFDGDGRLDLATADFLGGSVSVLLGTEGGFRSAPPVRLGGYPRSLLAGDFDGDGFDDLWVADGLRRTARLLRGNPQAPLQEEERGVSLPEVESPTLWASGDFDGDGLPDVAVAKEVPPFLTVGFGSLREGTRVDRYSLPLQPKALAAVDLTGDGRDELLVVGTAEDRGVLYIVGTTPSQ